NRFQPAECLVPSSIFQKKESSQHALEKEDQELAHILKILKENYNVFISSFKDSAFYKENAYETLLNHFKLLNLQGLGLEEKSLAISAAGGLLSYLYHSHKTNLSHVRTITTFSSTDYMILDATTQRNLELTQNLRDGSRKDTLLSVIDRTCTPMGSRLIKKWLLRPLIDVGEIKKRQEVVEHLIEVAFLKDDLTEILEKIYDMERLTGRIAYGTAHPRDLLSLKESIKALSRLKSVLKEAAENFKNGEEEMFVLFRDWIEMDDLHDIYKLIEKSIKEDAPTTLRSGGIIKEGYNEMVDSLREATTIDKKWVAALERREQKRTGIEKLKVKFNKVHGYFIEVPRSKAHLVPPDYERKQTLVNTERFVVPELREKESTIISSEEKILALEYELFQEILKEIASHSSRILEVSSLVAQLDVFCSLASVAVERDYVRPEVNESDVIDIKEGRHPVIEQILETDFVPNSTYLNTSTHRIALITGPNMAGKSTYMRQVALIVILAQMGSFVPAQSARIGIVDRIFTRIGAQDDLSRGMSTFMLEMTELANILNNATAKSLILLDEIGRGTSTLDGLSIAWATIEYIHNKKKIGAKTLFATHYHELVQIEEKLGGVKNLHVALKEVENDILFLRKMRPGGTDRSYGIQVSKLAGLPKEVIERAFELLKKLEKSEMTLVEEGLKSSEIEKRTKQMVFFKPVEEHPVLEEIRKIEVNSITPIEALNLLSEWKEKLKKG
ncbi:MAG TPA: DNA mismatch repair protein MutS, partial [Thermoplasmata archaeon]|nr:DNA mismatch repair protein MutS [Thermoplasmata archaeon]